MVSVTSPWPMGPLVSVGLGQTDSRVLQGRPSAGVLTIFAIDKSWNNVQFHFSQFLLKARSVRKVFIHFFPL